MNQDQVLSLVRAILQIAGTILVGHGVFKESDWTTVAGAVMMVVPVGWSMFVHSSQQKLASVAAMPNVRRIVTDPATADATPSPKVTAN